MSGDSLQRRYYPETNVGGFTAVDGTVAFYSRVQALAEAARDVLDLGCGRGAHQEDAIAFRRKLRDMRSPNRKVLGIDVDPGASTNAVIDEFRLIKGTRWPVDDLSIDICVADCVLEHVADVETFFSESRRVLKIGGYFCIRTTNKWSYVAIASILIPNAAHSRVLARVQDKRQERDVFPTRYRCNSIPRIRRMLRKHGFHGIVYGHEAEPSYLAFSRLAYLAGVLHQRFAPSFMAPTLFAFAKRDS
jgi:SAM-dependent methyltransferase